VGGLPQDRVVQFRISEQPLQPYVFMLEALQALGWSTFMPPYSFRHRKYVASVIPSNLHTAATVLPWANSTSA
jgi:hypothetical protein